MIDRLSVISLSAENSIETVENRYRSGELNRIDELYRVDENFHVEHRM